MMAGDDTGYFETLLLYYEEEIEGEAYFAALSKAFSDPDQREKMNFLAQVEGHAARAVAPLIAKYGLKPRPTDRLVAMGQGEAQDTRLDWAELLDEMRSTYPGYVEDFRALEDMAPAEDRPCLEFLTLHETAALEFLALEATEPRESASPLRRYLAQTPDIQDVRAV